LIFRVSQFGLNPSANTQSFDHESRRGKTRNPDQVRPMSALV
jgi:hypothetical protein